MSRGPIQILVIEDNAVNWRLVQRLLAQAGYEAHWAEEGLAGYEMALRLLPDLVLLDINLPGLSGFEVATKFKQHAELAKIPLIALTAKVRQHERETALVAGCDGLIPKPLDPFNFVSQVGAYLGGQREHIEKAREGPALRQFNVQVLEHLEAQLREAQEANKKLLEAQEALELRNNSLSRIIALSQTLLADHDPRSMLMRVLGEVREEARASGLVAYRIHTSGSYLEGMTWSSGGFSDAPVLGTDHPFLARLQAAGPGPVLRNEQLRGGRLWEEGLNAGFWSAGQEAALLVLRSHPEDFNLLGFWILTRPAGQRFIGAELEMVTLHASIAQVSLENAELILSLNNSTRALASSYERIEGAYQDLQNARADLGRRDRQAFLGGLFLKIAQRLADPVAVLHAQSEVLDAMMLAGGEAQGRLVEAQPKALAQIREAVAKIDSMLKALLRRVGGDHPSKPEWLDLHDLVQQELELLMAEGAIPSEVAVRLDTGTRAMPMFGVYEDFATALQHLIHHALGGPTPSRMLSVATRLEDGDFLLEVEDEGGPILPGELERAFEAFSGLHQDVVMGVRSPGQELASCRQLLDAYQARMTIANVGEGTRVSARVPLA